MNRAYRYLDPTAACVVSVLMCFYYCAYRLQLQQRRRGRIRKDSLLRPTVLWLWAGGINSFTPQLQQPPHSAQSGGEGGSWTWRVTDYLLLIISWSGFHKICGCISVTRVWCFFKVIFVTSPGNIGGIRSPRVQFFVPWICKGIVSGLWVTHSLIPEVYLIWFYSCSY